MYTSSFGSYCGSKVNVLWETKIPTLTLVPLRDGAPKYTYEGENNKAGIVAFMKNPGKAPEKPKEEVWSDTPSDVIHLTDGTFHEFIKVYIYTELRCIDSNFLLHFMLFSTIYRSWKVEVKVQIKVWWMADRN